MAPLVVLTFADRVEALGHVSQPGPAPPTYRRATGEGDAPPLMRLTELTARPATARGARWGPAGSLWRSIDGSALSLLSDQRADGNEPEGTALVYLVVFATPTQQSAELDAWYEQEHVALLLREPAWRRCRRYRAAPTGGNDISVALHELASPSALRSAARAAAMATPWRDTLADQPWFSSKRSALYVPAHDTTYRYP